MKLENIRKIIIALLIGAIALSGVISYFTKGNVSINVKPNYELTAGKEESQDAAEKAEMENTEKEAVDSGKVNINTAGLDELQVAPGIGPSKAQKIIDYRNTYGKFVSVDELLEISGIGEKTLAKIRDYYCVE